MFRSLRAGSNKAAAGSRLPKSVSQGEEILPAARQSRQKSSVGTVAQRHNSAVKQHSLQGEGKHGMPPLQHKPQLTKAWDEATANSNRSTLDHRSHEAEEQQSSRQPCNGIAKACNGEGVHSQKGCGCNEIKVQLPKGLSTAYIGRHSTHPEVGKAGSTGKRLIPKDQQDNTAGGKQGERADNHLTLKVPASIGQPLHYSIGLHSPLGKTHLSCRLYSSGEFK